MIYTVTVIVSSLRHRKSFTLCSHEKTFCRAWQAPRTRLLYCEWQSPHLLHWDWQAQTTCSFYWAYSEPWQHHLPWVPDTAATPPSPCTDSQDDILELYASFIGHGRHRVQTSFSGPDKHQGNTLFNVVWQTRLLMPCFLYQDWHALLFSTGLKRATHTAKKMHWKLISKHCALLIP